MSNYTHLESLCAHFGGQIAQNKNQVKDPKRMETIIRNAAGVMRKEGVFAFYLYLRYRWSEGGKVIWPQIRSLWREKAVGPLLDDEDERDAIITLTDNLSKLLLARQLAERALIYALYGLREQTTKLTSSGHSQQQNTTKPQEA